LPAVEIVKERGRFPDRTPGGECGNLSESVDIWLPDLRVARGFPETGDIDDA
jgi:hypothetical protein